MFSRKSEEPLPDVSDVQVKLKPVLGVQPGVYLSVLYTVLLLLLVFMILFFPGIRAYGTYVHLTSLPGDAAIWIDGEYRGAAPRTVFVRAGSRTIELRKASYRTHTEKRRIGGRIFGTLFAPRRTTLAVSLALEQPDELLQNTLEETCSWGMLSRFSPGQPLPPVLSSGAKAVWSLRGEEADRFRRLFGRLLENAAFFVDSPPELLEILRAAVLLEMRGPLPDSVSLAKTARRCAAFLTETATSPYWLLRALPSRAALGADRAETAVAAEDLIESGWFAGFHSSYFARLDLFQEGTAGGGRADMPRIAGLSFRPVPGGRYVSGRDPEQSRQRIDEYFSIPVSVPPFLMAETETTNAQFAVFLSENPAWAPSNRESLSSRGLVGDGYLAGWTGAEPAEGHGDLPVTGVSYHAAAAYCEWLTTKLPPAYSAYRARLPYEEEWDWALLAGSAQAKPAAVFERDDGPEPVLSTAPNGLGLRGLMGNVWEWCESWSLPGKNLLLDSWPRDVQSFYSGAPHGSERVVKGGSWANQEEDIHMYSRGSQPPEWCTPYLGFRVVLERTVRD